MSYVGLTADLVEEAVDIVAPTISYMMIGGKVKRPCGNLVVLKPEIPYEPKYKTWRNNANVPQQHPFEEVILFERQWLPELWGDAPYKDVSRSKAFASWKHRMSTRRMQDEAPWAYEPMWTKWPGSIWLPGNLVVSYSGVEDYGDQAICMLVHGAIWFVCMREVHGPHGVMANKELTFLGE